MTKAKARGACALGIGMTMLSGCYQGVGGAAAGDGADASATGGESGSATAAESGGDEAGDDDDPEPVDGDAVGISGLRRLSAAEYDQTVFDLVGVRPEAELILPEDLRSPFDNDYTIQSVSAALIEGADHLAGEVAEQVVDDPTLRAAIVPCAPASAGDEACLREFIAAFGKRALRRSLTEDEIGVLAGFIDHAEEAGDFWVAVDSVLRTLLQHTELLYRVELGTPVADEPGLFRLGGTEVATRLSYLLWGSTPPLWLIEAAESGELSNAEEIATATQTLLDEPHARERIYRFHGMWMGFERSGGGELGDAMKRETSALLERTVFEEKTPWADLLRADETFVDAALATHYGLPAPAGTEPQWVAYGDSGRRGLLSHASFLSVGTKNGDTSATLRGKNIRENLLCQDIPPPPANVNTDAPPPGFDDTDCKAQRYVLYAANDGCAACHAQMDPIGLGLESYDSAGRWRATEPDRPDCPIEGHGVISGTGEFDGPAGLADLLVAAPTLDQCIVTQVYRFAIGRAQLDATDTAFITGLLAELGDDEIVFDELLLALVSSSEFRHRRGEES